MILIWTLAFLFVSLCISAEESYKCENLEEFDAAEKGEITSPLYSRENYPNNLWCEYRISAPDGYRIKLTFEDMDIKPSGSCGSDKLVVYGKNKETVLGVYCGFQIPNPVLSHEDENEVRLLFETDNIGSGRGFKLTYESSPYIEMCEENEGECRNRNCYPVDKMCDGVDDCGDGTDEEDCDMPIVSLPTEDACGKTPIKPDTIYGSPDRVVGGTAAVPNSWPWQVSFQRAYIEPNGHFCGGTLINAQWVISAAHCFADNPFPPTIRIHLGSHNKFNKTKFEQMRVAKKIISYPDLEGEKLMSYSQTHDIALVKLNAPVSFNDGIQPACLPHLGWEVKPGWHCYTTGWGETKGSGFSDVLKQVPQIVQHPDDCQFDNETEICVDKEQNSPCHGDSGGPLVCRLAGQWYVMGATSRGTGSDYMSGLCATPDSKIVFSKVADKGNWIRQTIDMNS